MFKKLLLFCLFISLACKGMLNPFTNSVLLDSIKESAADFGLNTVKNLDTPVKTLVNGLQEGLSDTTAHLTQAINGSTANMTKALTTTSAHLERTIITSSAEVCRTVTQTTGQLTTTANKLIDAGIPALNQNINALVNSGVQARLYIDPNSIKTLCFSTTGAALAMAGIGLILYESFFVEDYSTETPKPTTWSATVKNFVKNRYVLGSASIAAGLCLIAKSTTL